MRILENIFVLISRLACMLGAFIMVYIFIMAMAGAIKLTHIDDGKNEIIIRIH